MARGGPTWSSRIEVVSLDVTSDASVSAARAQIAASTGGDSLYGLVNNAGIGTGAGASFADVLAVNVLGVHRVCEAFLPLLAPNKGRIVNVTGAIVAKALNAASPAKAALESWSKALAADLAPHGITVNCIAPGRINSVQILNRLHPTEESRRAFIERNIPAGRFDEPEEVAPLVAFLASPQAAYITGTTIPVDGGALRLAF